MSAQLQQLHRPSIGGPRGTLVTPPRRSPPNLVVVGESRFDHSRADEDAGLGLLLRFVLATSVVVAVVVLVDAVGQDWILVPAMAIHLAVTYAVLHRIFALLRERYEGEAPDA